jgi:hypothetical protein
MLSHFACTTVSPKLASRIQAIESRLVYHRARISLLRRYLLKESQRHWLLIEKQSPRRCWVPSKRFTQSGILKSGQSRSVTHGQPHSLALAFCNTSRKVAAGSRMSQPLRGGVRTLYSIRAGPARVRQDVASLPRWQTRCVQIRAAPSEQPGAVNGNSLAVVDTPSSVESAGMCLQG